MDYSREQNLWVTPHERRRSLLAGSEFRADRAPQRLPPGVLAALNPIAAEMSHVWRSEAPHLSLRAL